MHFSKQKLFLIVSSGDVQTDAVQTDIILQLLRLKMELISMLLHLALQESFGVFTFFVFIIVAALDGSEC